MQSQLQTSKFFMTNSHVASFICQMYMCTYSEFSMTSFWFSDRHDIAITTTDR